MYLKTGVYYNPIIDNIVVLRRTKMQKLTDIKTFKEETTLMATIIFYDGKLYKNIAMYGVESLIYLGTF